MAKKKLTKPVKKDAKADPKGKDAKKGFVPFWAKDKGKKK